VAVAQAKTAVPEARVVVGNAQTLPYDDATFDLITCLGSLERMLDSSQALQEMHRIGKPGARYCFLVRNSATFSWIYLAWLNSKQRSLSHAGANTLRNWKALFEAQGFRIKTTLPDQYPLLRRRGWGSLFLRPVDFRRPLTGKQPLDQANEFVFVLEKRR
jgi:ubiquinone/menaquinone biosynthesis C-methylase UbiE